MFFEEFGDLLNIVIFRLFSVLFHSGVIDKRHSFDALRECLQDILQPAYQTLTPRQQDVFRLIGEGKSTKEIANLLNSAISTVESHRKAIAQKLNISGAELVREASLTRQILRQP